MARSRTQDDAPPPSPVLEEISRHDTQSMVAVVGHPLPAMMIHFPIALAIATLGADLFYWYTGDPFWTRAAVWSAGFAFGAAVAAGMVGTAVLLLVKGIRVRVASWTHAIAAMTFISIVGLNWGVRLIDPAAVLPHGLALSALSTFFAGLAGWHGGKLIFDHGIGVMVSSEK